MNKKGTCGVVVAGAATILACAGCGANTPPTTDPLLICGDNIAGGYVVPIVIDATSGNRTITGQSADSDIFLRLVNDCQHGVRLAIDPPTAATVIGQAKASDGLPVAVELQIHRLNFVIDVNRPDRTSSSLQVVGAGS